MLQQFHSSVVKDRQKPFADISMTTLFYKEARRLWDLEEGKDSVTKLQAGICLCTLCSYALPNVLLKTFTLKD